MFESMEAEKRLRDDDNDDDEEELDLRARSPQEEGRTSLALRAISGEMAGFGGLVVVTVVVVVEVVVDAVVVKVAVVVDVVGPVVDGVPRLNPHPSSSLSSAQSRLPSQTLPLLTHPPPLHRKSFLLHQRPFGVTHPNSSAPLPTQST